MITNIEHMESLCPRKRVGGAPKVWEEVSNLRCGLWGAAISFHLYDTNFVAFQHPLTHTYSRVHIGLIRVEKC